MGWRLVSLGMFVEQFEEPEKKLTVISFKLVARTVTSNVSMSTAM